MWKASCSAKSSRENTLAGHHLHIDLNALARIGHLLIGFRMKDSFLLLWRKQPRFAHDPEQALQAAGITSLPQPVPQLHHTQVWITAAQIPDQFQLCRCVLIGMTAGPPGLAGQGFHGAVPARFPEVDVRPALVVPPAGPADAVFLCILYQGLPV